MTAGIVDDLELIEVEVAKRVRCLPGLGAFQRPFKPRLELRTINKTCQDIVTGVVTQAPVQFAGFTDVVENKYTTRNFTFAVANRRCCTLYIQFITIATDE